MVDEAKAKEILTKIKDGSFSIDDLIPYLDVFIEIAKENEDVQYELEGWDRRMNFNITDGPNFSLTIEDGDIKLGDELDNPDITFEFDKRTAVGIFTGEIDATSAYMGGDLKIIGPLPDAVKFRTIVELIREELEDFND